MASWPANGTENWNTEMNAFVLVGHAADGTHNQAGLTAQVVNNQTGAGSTGTTTVPFDNTIPQITEGDQYLTLAVTPKSATNKLKIEVTINLSHSSIGAMTTALFQDSTANALAAVSHSHIGNGMAPTTFTHFMTAGTTSATTFRVRAGSSVGGTTTFNGNGGTQKMGGVLISSINITEIWV